MRHCYSGQGGLRVAVVDVVAPMMPVSALLLAIARWPILLDAGSF